VQERGQDRRAEGVDGEVEMSATETINCACGDELIYDPESQRNHSEYAPAYDCPACGNRYVVGNHLSLLAITDRKKWHLLEVPRRIPVSD